MTVKEIAEFAGKKDRTIRNWIVKAGEKNSSVEEKNSSAGHGKIVNYEIDEVEEILKSGSLSKDAVSILMENARKPKPKELVIKTGGLEEAFKMMACSFNKLVSITESQEKRLLKIEDKIEERKALLPAPSISPRQNVSKIVREYATNNKTDYRVAYGKLYKEFYYRTHVNVSERAKNREMSKMDYIEAEGMIGTLESIAIDTMQ